MPDVVELLPKPFASSATSLFPSAEEQTHVQMSLGALVFVQVAPESDDL